MTKANKPAPAPAVSTPRAPTAPTAPTEGLRKKKVTLDIDEVDVSENLERKISA